MGKPSLSGIVGAASATSGIQEGYNYRYYSATDIYVGTKKGSAHLMGADKVIHDQGKLSGFMGLVQCAGF
jgi:hypothetical protein